MAEPLAPERATDLPGADASVPLGRARETGRGSASELRDDRITVVRPVGRLPRLDLAELWRYRELFATLVWRDITVRYKQTAIGVAWAILQPFLLMVVMTLVFGKFANFPSDGLPYPIFNYSGLLPWTYFATALALVSASVVSSRGLVTKVYFPRVILPGSSALVPLVDFALAFVVLAGMWVWFSIYPTALIVLLPLFLLLALLTALGVGLWLAALNVRYRDVPFIVPFLIQVWFWLTPVAYSTNQLEEHYQWILALNPMSGVIEGFRWVLLDSQPPNPAQLTISVAAALLFVVSGTAFFRASEPRFADTI
jgi:lipopolysaccharide transport system permease protein